MPNFICTNDYHCVEFDCTDDIKDIMVLNMYLVSFLLTGLGFVFYKYQEVNNELKRYIEESIDIEKELDTDEEYNADPASDSEDDSQGDSEDDSENDSEETNSKESEEDSDRDNSDLDNVSNSEINSEDSDETKHTRSGWFY